MPKLIFILLNIHVYAGFVKTFLDNMPNIQIPEVVNITEFNEQVTTQVICNLNQQINLS